VVTREAWRTLAAAMLGWMLDGMDVMLYAFALTTIQAEFGMSSAAAGAMASMTLVTSAIGGALAGFFADRYGRARVLVWSILIYSVFTGMTATARTMWELAFWRALVGFGLGAEWSAGSVLVAETWPPEHRGKAIGFMQSGWAIGYILAALLAAAIIPAWGWRALFIVGTLPALLTLWVRRAVKEPDIWRRAERRSVTGVVGRRLVLATLMCASVLFAYWGLFTWIPAFLASPVERGGAGLGLVRSTGWIIPAQIGAFLGYTTFGFFSDRWGRRPVFITFVVAAAALVPIYGLTARNPATLMLLGPLIGFFGHGYFSVFGALLAELFPSGVRATAQGIAYNAGRALSALAPPAIGAVADQTGIGAALAVTSAFFLAGAGIMLMLPETKGEALQ
jgi:MFS family permease